MARHVAVSSVREKGAGATVRVISHARILHTAKTTAYSVTQLDAYILIIVIHRVLTNWGNDFCSITLEGSHQPGPLVTR